MYYRIETIFTQVVRYSALALEIIGVAIILATIAKCLWQMLRYRRNIRVPMAEGIQLALMFKLAAEVLKTVLVSSWQEIAQLGAIVAVRAAITLLLHWEGEQEKRVEARRDPE